uniref:RBR-type E3 ubiquitin transferase n=1 Tax=Caenorhabditis japonica TaxID=281687 RepID=A0A8R1EPM1_CAEJA
MSYITDPIVIASYRRLIVASYVETNRLLKWCPGVDCGKAVKVNHCEPRLVVCTCGSRFCFSCGNDWHEPVNCRLLKLWMKKCSDDSENVEIGLKCLSDDDGIALESHEQNSLDFKDGSTANEVLNHDQLETEMKKTIGDVQAVLQVKSGVCRILLHKYKWNKESLLERFYEHPDTNAFLIDAQVIPRRTEKLPRGDAECDICCMLSDLSGLACNHRA